MGCIHNTKSRGKITIRGNCSCGSEDVVGGSEKCLGENNAARSRNGQGCVCVSNQPQF